MSLKIEKYWPRVVAVLPAAASWYFRVELGQRAEVILGTAATVGSILVGFMAMAYPLFLSLDSKLMVKLRQTDYFGLITGYMKGTIWLSLLMTIVSFVYLFIQNPDRLRFVVPWIWIVSWALFSFIRTSNVFFIAIERDAEFKS